MAAPVLGGVVYRQSGYAGVFGLGFAILAVDFIMRLLIIEKKTAARYVSTNGGEEPNGHASQDQEDPQDGDAEDEDGEEDPLIRKKETNEYKIPPGQPRWIRSFPILYCLKDPRLLTAFLLALVQATLLATFDATIPVSCIPVVSDSHVLANSMQTLAQEYYGYDSLKAGLLFIALVLPYLAMGPLAGWAVDHYGAKPAAVIGFGYLVPVLILLRLVRPGGRPEVVVFCALLALCGIGMGIIGSPSIVEASFVIQMYDKANPDFFGINGPYAQLYGLNSMVFSLGLTIGPLVSGALKDSIGYGNMNLVVAILCLVTAALSFIFVGGKPAMIKRRRA